MKKTSLFVIASVFFLLSSCIPSLHSIVDDKNRITDDRLIGNWSLKEDMLGISNVTFSIKPDDVDNQIEGAGNMQTFVDSLTNPEDYSFWTFERAAKLTFTYAKTRKGISGWTHECIGGAESTFKQLKEQYKNEDIIISKKELLPYYLLSHQEGGEEESALLMKVELTKIGGDLYMDIFPKNVSSVEGRFALNFIGAHTFAKINFEGNKLFMQSFAIDQIEHLIETNQASLKHEIIKIPSYEGNELVFDENFLLTSSTEELRAFILQHGKNEDLFDSPEVLIPLF